MLFWRRERDARRLADIAAILPPHLAQLWLLFSKIGAAGASEFAKVLAANCTLTTVCSAGHCTAGTTIRMATAPCELNKYDPRCICLVRTALALVQQFDDAGTAAFTKSIDSQ